MVVRNTGPDSMEDFVVIDKDNCTMQEPLHTVVAKIVPIVTDSLGESEQMKPTWQFSLTQLLYWLFRSTIRCSNWLM